MDTKDYIFQEQFGTGLLSTSGGWQEIEDWFSCAKKLPTIEEEMDREAAHREVLEEERGNEQVLSGEAQRGLETLDAILAKGGEFLLNLRKTLCTPAPLEEEPISPSVPQVNRDPKTGKPYLTIPLPEPEVIQNIFSALSGWFTSIAKK